MADYKYINKYPHLRRFCAEEQVSLVPVTYPFQQLMLQEIIQVNVNSTVRDDYDKRRSNLDRCLGFAYKYKLMNSDRRGRLKSRDQNFWSTFGELRVGHWLESLGFSFIEFDPPAQNAQKGDYLVSLDQSDNIFIEVKVFSGDRGYCSQSALLSQIASLTQEIEPNINDITINEYNYMDTEARKNLLSEIRRFLETTRIPAIFKDQKLRIEIAFDIKPGMPFSIGWGGSMRTAEKLADLLQGVQLSKDPIPSLVFVYDLDSLASNVIENVLYGNTVSDSVNGKSYRKSDGIWNVKHKSSLSAVGILKFSLDSVFPSEATIYLAPKAKYIIEVADFSASAVKFMSLDSNGYDLKIT